MESKFFSFFIGNEKQIREINLKLRNIYNAHCTLHRHNLCVLPLTPHSHHGVMHIFGTVESYRERVDDDKNAFELNH